MFNQISGQANSTYTAQGVGQQNVAMPKELGFIQRLEGIRSGLETIEGRFRGLASRVGGQEQSPPTQLETIEGRFRDLASRVGGQEQSPPTQSAAIPTGVPGNLNAAEVSIRNIFDLLNAFDKAF